MVIVNFCSDVAFKLLLWKKKRSICIIAGRPAVFLLVDLTVDYFQEISQNYEETTQGNSIY